MNNIFNTPFEVSLRILIILNTVKNRVSVERITALDFISTYGKDFGVSEYNLHGDNSFRFSEYTLKRKIISESIKELVLKGYINPHCNKNGFNYSISKNGTDFCNALNDNYAEEFAAIVNKSNEIYQNYSDRKLAHHINEYAIAMVGGK